MADSSKQAQLVKSIADAVSETMVPQIGAQFADLMVMVGAIAARLEVLEGMMSAGGAAKRPVKTERKTAATAGAAAGGAAGAPDPREKVKNAMLYVRWIWANSAEFREKYDCEDLQGLFEAEAAVSKLEQGTEKRYLAEGSLVWKKFLTDAQKSEVKEEFGRWKEDIKRENLAEPLDADADAAEDEA